MKNILREGLSFIGFVSAAYGVYQIYEPAAFIIAGGFLLWISFPKGSN